MVEGTLLPHLTLEGRALARGAVNTLSGFPPPGAIQSYLRNNSATAFFAACFFTNRYTQDNFLNLIFS